MMLSFCYVNSNWPLLNFPVILWLYCRYTIRMCFNTKPCSNTLPQLHICYMWYIQYFNLLSAHYYSAHFPNCRFNMTHTCHLGVVGDSHTANVVVGCCRHLPSTSCAMTGDNKKQNIVKRIYMTLHTFTMVIMWVKSEIGFLRLTQLLFLLTFFLTRMRKSLIEKI